MKLAFLANVVGVLLWFREPSLAAVASDGTYVQNNSIKASKCLQLTRERWQRQRLPSQRSFRSAFKDQEDILIEFEVKAQNDYSIIWSSSKESWVHLNRSERLCIEQQQREDSINVFSFPIIKPDQWRIEKVTSPGETFSCHVLVPNYYQIVTNSNQVISRFYAVTFLIQPSLETYNNCNEAGGSGVVKFTPNIADAPIGFLLAIKDRNFIVDVLTGNLIEFNNMIDIQNKKLGRIYIIDADSINNELTSDKKSNPRYRNALFLKRMRNMD